MQRTIFLSLFALSGAAALVYEVAWTRLLTLQLGHGVAAASTVLAAFMGGLAAGAALGGRVGNRLDPSRALAVYAGLELSIAALALLLPAGIAALTPLLAAAYADGAGGAWFATLRVLASLLLLSIPAAAMGATFPVAARWMVRRASDAGARAGSLYAANTMGAAAGALLAGFVLLPLLGLRGTTWIGVLLNLAAAGGAWWLQRHAPSAAEAAVASAPPQAQRSTGGRDHGREQPSRRQTKRSHRSPAAAAPPGVPLTAGVHRGWIAAALALSGLASLSMQVVWTRLFALVLGPTTYAFSLVVTVFIAGLAIGSGLAARTAARRRDPVFGLTLCLVASVGLALAAAAAVDWTLLSMAGMVSRPNATFQSVLTRQLLLVSALVLPMTIAFGAAMPLAIAAAVTRDAEAITDLSLVYAANTVGAIGGALLTGFVLVPALGLQGTLRLVAGIVALGGAGLALLIRPGTRRRTIAVLSAAAVLAAALFLPPWSRLLLSSGAYKYAASLSGPDLATALTAGELRYYREGAAGTVAVRDLTGTTSLAIDGKVDASNGGDMLTQRLLAHVPLLLHPSPRSAAILGLGSGVTLGSALRHPLERATVLEISPEVVDASAFFRRENHDALADPRTTLIVGDGRTHLQLTRQRYDVIVSEPSNPWMAGIASLFTQEFFSTARARLTETGVFCQWAHTYDISREDLRSIVATFLTVFPEGTLWLVGDGDVLLIGSPQPLGPRLAQLEEGWQRPGVASDLASVGAVSPSTVRSLFVADGTALRGWAGDAVIQRDDRASLEFSGPRSVFGQQSNDNAESLRALAKGTPPPAAIAQTPPTAADLRDLGWMLLDADAFRPAHASFEQALALDPRDQRALDGLLRTSPYVRAGHRTSQLVGRLAEDPGNAPARLALSRMLAAEGQWEAAAQIPVAMLRDDPSNLAALEQLASILSDAGDAERLEPVVARLRTVAGGSAAAHYYAAALLFMQEQPVLAASEARAVVTADGRHARAHNLLGAALASLGQRDEARAAFRASLDADPRDPATYANLGRLELESGNAEQAAQHFASALLVDPASQTARQGLEEAKALRQ